MKTAILGGGLSGLTVGYLLAQQGVEFEVLEKEPTCGGLMRTLQENGFTFDYGGSHIIFSKNQKALDFLLNLLGNNVVKNRRTTKIFYKGTHVKYPFENGLSDLPKQENYECLTAFIKNLIEKQKGEVRKPENLKQWFYSTFGAGITEKYLLPYNEKIWKHPVEDLGLDWVERIPDPPMEDIIKSSLGIETEGYLHQLHFYYPKVGGIQALIDALCVPIQNSIVTGFEVKQITKEDKQWVISDGKQEKRFDLIISTLPIQELIKIMEAPTQVKVAASQLKCNALITIMIGLYQGDSTGLSWLYIPDRQILTHRVSFPSNYSPCVVPSGKAAILAEVTCNVNDEVWNRTDQDLTDQILNDLDKAGILNKQQVCFTRTKKAEYAYVINDLAYKKNLEVVTDFLNDEGILFVGRFAQFKYLNMDDCIESALDFMDKHSEIK